MSEKRDGARAISRYGERETKFRSQNSGMCVKWLMRDGITISEQTAKRFHKILTANVFEKAGKYRVHNVVLGDFEPPSSFQVPEHMKNWEADYQERLKHKYMPGEKYELCAWLIHRFLWIHPFFDYNGRVARLLGELFLLKNNLPLVAFHAVQRMDFVKAVKEATATGDLSLLIQILQKRR